VRSTWRRRVRARRTDESGFAAILVAVFCAVLVLPLCAISVDVANWYLQIARVQNAADAAAQAGVTWLPDDFTSATSTAKDVASDNGYAVSATTAVTTAIGAKPTQLVVTIRTKVNNIFGSSIGFPTTAITRSATADYNGPAPMGSPCNAFGNEPNGTSALGPSTSVIVAPTGGASCPATPQFWAAIAGPDTAKGNGDQYMTRTCGANNDGCESASNGADNDDFNPTGYYYIVRVAAAAVNSPITLQVYDPSWVSTGDLCPDSPTETSGLALANAMNNYTTTDGTTRYDNTNNAFCSGDVDNGTGSTPIVTSFGLRAPTTTYQPSNGAPVSGCAKQYPGYLLTKPGANTQANPDSISTGTLAKDITTTTTTTTGTGTTTTTSTAANPKYNDNLAKVFHQWVPFCTFTPTAVGDYYLQVRTNVAVASGATLDSTGAYAGNTKIFTQTGDDTSVGGVGNNRFSLRAYNTSTTVRGAVSVAGWQNMSIYANYAGSSPTFNLVRVIPAAQTKTLTIHFFDLGDISGGSGTVTVLPPADAKQGTTTMSTFSGCTGAGVTTTVGTGCQITGVTSASYNGRLQTISVPIPSNYTCNSTASGGCWVRLQMNFPGATNVSDTTTWSASIDGDPVRLIK
jgi:hypothetical protein